MNFLKHIIFALVLFGASIHSVEAQVVYKEPMKQATETTVYTVKMGDTAYSVALSHGIKEQDIYNLNPGTDKGLKAGQKIKLPLQKAFQEVGKENNSPNLTSHEIEPKETLNSVSRKYGTTVYELLRVNPGLSESSFNIGKIINIPQGNSIQVVDVNPSQVDAAFAKSTLIQHKVKRKETLYNLSKRYNVSVEEIKRLNPNVKDFDLKEGSVISIPSSSDNRYASNDMQLKRVDTTINPNVFYPRDGVVRVALLLPFLKGSESVSVEKIEEYYEGFLLAVHKLKEQGLNAEVYTFDIGTDNDTRRLESILGTRELNDLNLVVGGISDKQVKLISKFSQMTGTNYVVPFNNKDAGVMQNRSEFQIANSHTNLFPKISKHLVSRFKDYNIIFLSELGSDKNKRDFVKAFQSELQTSGIRYKSAPTTASVTDDLKSVIDRTKKNLIVPSSHSEEGLRKILDGMDAVGNDGIEMSILGYPEWQTYINTLPRLHKCNTYFYSMFYLDTKSPAAQLFADKYRQWFNKTLVVAYPKFAHMGYDTGMLFLTALKKYGHRFSPHINDLGIQTLQSSLYFELASQDGGYVNSGVYLVHLRPDQSVSKFEIK